MRELAAREQPYLFKLRLTAGIKRLLERRCFGAHWEDAGAGGVGTDDHLRLSGWDRDRRVVILRRRLQGDMLLAGRIEGQEVLAFVEAEAPPQRYEYAVLVTLLPHAVLTVAQL